MVSVQFSRKGKVPTTLKTVKLVKAASRLEDLVRWIQKDSKKNHRLLKDEVPDCLTYGVNNTPHERKAYNTMTVEEL